MSTRPVFLTLDNAEKIIMAELYMMCAAYSKLAVQFTISNYDFENHEVRCICCYQPIPDCPDDLPTLPMMFLVEAVIVPWDCFLTALGHEGYDGLAEDPLVSFWLESRRHGDHFARICWEHVSPAIEAIAETVPWEVDLTEVMSRSPTDDHVRLQIKWQPSPGETIASSLPMYSKTGKRFVPMSFADVPFGEAVRVGFSLEYSYKYDDPYRRPRVLHALLSHISVL